MHISSFSPLTDSLPVINSWLISVKLLGVDSNFIVIYCLLCTYCFDFKWHSWTWTLKVFYYSQFMIVWSSQFMQVMWWHLRVMLIWHLKNPRVYRFSIIIIIIIGGTIFTVIRLQRIIVHWDSNFNSFENFSLFLIICV